MSFCRTAYYVDAKIGDDSSNGSREIPFKTLTYALKYSKDVAAVIYLREAQTFSDLTSKIEIASSIFIK